MPGSGVTAQLSPRGERLPRGGHSFINVLLGALYGGGQHLACARVARVIPLPVLRRHPLVVDKVSQLPAMVLQPRLGDDGREMQYWNTETFPAEAPGGEWFYEAYN